MNPPASDPAQLAGLFHGLMGLVQRRYRGESMSLLAESGITMPQLVAMHVLHYTGPSSVTGLVDKLHLSVSATSHLVDRLHERGYVERVEDPDDRRQKRVSISPAGFALMERLQAERSREFARVMADLDPSLRADLAAVFSRTIAALGGDAPDACGPRGPFEDPTDGDR